jgi:hypothetical protein
VHDLLEERRGAFLLLLSLLLLLRLPPERVRAPVSTGRTGVELSGEECIEDVLRAEVVAAVVLLVESTTATTAARGSTAALRFILAVGVVVGTLVGVRQSLEGRIHHFEGLFSLGSFVFVGVLHT